MSDLLKKDAEWTWSEAQVDVLTSVKRSLVEASVLALPDAAKRCDYFAISSALLQKDDDGIDRVTSYQSRLQRLRS